MSASASSGAIGAAIANPTGLWQCHSLLEISLFITILDLIKVRMQADGGLRHDAKYKGIVDACSKIIRNEGGVVALYKVGTFD